MDVLVIGAGPAGGTCATLLARRGHSVTCIDASDAPGAAHTPKIDITESKGVEDLLSVLGIRPLSKTSCSVWRAGTASLRYDSAVSDLFFLRGTDSESLDTQLAGCMVQSGVDLKFGEKVTGIRIKSDGACSATIDINGNSRTLEPDAVVLACGEASELIGKLGITEYRYGHIVGHGGLYRDLSLEQESVWVCFNPQKAPGGYLFAGRANQQLGIAMLVRDELMTNMDLPPIESVWQQAIVEWEPLRCIVQGATLLGESKGCGLVAELDRHAVGNVFLCGDAARCLSPWFAYGVRPSLLCGAELADVLETGLPIPAMRQRYESLLRALKGNPWSGRFARRMMQALDLRDYEHLVSGADQIHAKFNLDRVIDHGKVPIAAILRHMAMHPYAATHCTFKSIRSAWNSLRKHV